MAASRNVSVFYDERVLTHEPDIQVPFLPGRLDKRVREMLSGINADWKYPEHPGRLRAVMELLARQPIPGLRFEPGRVATREELARVHTTSYLDEIETLRGKNAWLDVDTTAVSPGSVDAAEVAAGTSLAAVEAVLKKQTGTAFALIRPPGHHAESVRARGFCMFNNIAVAATHAQSALGCRRVLILDWDAHHGNGTQEIFRADPDVMLVDIHRSAPFYPGSGAIEETGVGLGEGTIINIPVPAGTGDIAFVKAMREILVPAAEWFRPELILVSAGFDAHRQDLALDVTHEGFSAITGIVRDLADRLCQGRLAFILEGGYNLDSLSLGVHTVLNVLAGAMPAEPREPGVAEVESAKAMHCGRFSSEE